MSRIPKPFFVAGAILAVVALIPIAWITRARVTRSPRPRMHFVPDMDNQPRYGPQDASPLFTDGRAMREPVEGVVPRGALDLPRAVRDGRTGAGEDGWVEEIPLPVTPELMRRGRERFGIFCAPCHGLAGQGDGMIARRAEELEQPAWIPPVALTGAAVVDRPDGHIYNTIAHGVRSMAGYGDQIPVEDRWAIVAYVRALQRARNATVDDVPPERRQELR